MSAKNKLLIVAGLAAVMVLMLACQSFAGPPDIQNHWAEKQISNWIESGLISGYPDGSFGPENNITRAEFIAMVNRSFGKSVMTKVYYPDVADSDWFAAEVAKAAAAGYVSGYNDGTFRPNEYIERQEAAVMISRLLGLDASAGADIAEQFADSGEIPPWCKGAIGAVANKGYMSGYPDQTFRPAGYITRAESVSTLNRALAASVTSFKYDKMGTYGPAEGVETIDGSVNISAAGVTLQNTVITGNLFLADSIGDGDVTLKNVIVRGNTVIKGGGSQSVVLENCALPNITIGKKGVRIVASGNTSVSIVRLETGAALVEVSLSGPGFETVNVTELVPAGAEITLDGNFDNVRISAEAVSLKITGGTITSLDVAETAAGAAIDVAGNASIGIITLNAATSVTGKGTIEIAKINVSGSTFEQEPKNIEKADDITVTTGAGGVPSTATITISNIEATNTLGKFKFDTDTVTTTEALEGKIMGDGVDVINVAKRNSGEDGKVWNAYLATTPYEYDTEYEITCESPLVISGNGIVMWSSSSAAPAAINVTADDIDNNGDGSDLEVSFDSQRGQNTRIESYRVMAVKSSDASSFTLSDANAVTHYTTVYRIEDAPSYTVVLSADAKDIDGDAITEDVSYKVFVLSVADGINATENALSAASSSIILSSSGVSGGPTITIIDVLKTNTLGKFKFNTDTATTDTALLGKIIAGGVDAIGIGPRNNDTTGKLWNADFAFVPEYNTNYEIDCEDPFMISGSSIVMWQGDNAAPATTGVTVSDVGDSGNGSDLEVSFIRPSGENTKIASYRIMVVKSLDSSSFNLSVANAVYEDYYTKLSKTGADSYTTALDAAAKDIDGNVITDGTAYNVFVLSVADGVNATVNALSDASNEVTLSGGISALELVGSEVTTQGDVGLYFNKAITDPTGIGSESQFTVRVNDVEAGILSVIKTNTTGKIKIVMAIKITSGQNVTVAYTKSAVEASWITSSEDSSVLESFEAQSVPNEI
jgi:hypothetical protein